MNFINKVVEKISIERKKNNLIEGVTVLMGSKENPRLDILIDGILYPIHKYNDRQGVTTIYSSPLNDKHPIWTKKERKKKLTSHPEIVNQYWWRYKANMKLKGEIKDNIFYPNE